VKEIKRTYYQANKDKVYEQSKQRRLDDPERDRRYKTKYREANIEEIRRKARIKKKENPAKNAADTQARHAAKLRATPAWADLKAIEKFYIEAKRLEKQDGIKRHVDHIVPLRGKKVCGFHVQNNLQILTAEENQKKLNKHDD
jgi:hypothetical protein